FTYHHSAALLHTAIISYKYRLPKELASSSYACCNGWRTFSYPFLCTDLPTCPSDSVHPFHSSVHSSVHRPADCPAGRPPSLHHAERFPHPLCGGRAFVPPLQSSFYLFYHQTYHLSPFFLFIFPQERRLNPGSG